MNCNPWPIANLWMTLYYLETGEKKIAKETCDGVIKTAGKHYLRGEQIDNNTLKPNWVIGRRMVTCNVYNRPRKNFEKLGDRLEIFGDGAFLSHSLFETKTLKSPFVSKIKKSTCKVLFFVIQ